MSRNFKIISIVAVIAIILVVICGYSLKDRKTGKNSDKLSIVVTTFSTYDFSLLFVGDNAEVTYLLGPGVDSHGYEPSANDLMKIKNADVFIYIGGEMEKWVEKVFETDVIDQNKTKTIRVTDCIDTIEEVEVDGAEEEEEEEAEGAFDEHIWTSPTNAKKMVEYLGKEFGNIDTANKDLYTKNAEEYVAKIEDVRLKIEDIVNNKKRNRLVFGDKMPMQYFLNEFGLEASAAFSGCSTETEPSTKTVTYLINKVKEEKIPVVLYIELSTGKSAKSIAAEAGVEAMQIQTLHNVSKDDFEAGETYVSLMNRNLKVLEKALK